MGVYRKAAFIDFQFQILLYKLHIMNHKDGLPPS